MLFNSYIFIFLFLPSTLLLYFTVAKHSQKLALLILLLASLVFYSGYNYHYALILLASIAANFIFAKAILAHSLPQIKKFILTVGILFNLSLLAYFKYANFFIANVNSLVHTHMYLLDVALPLGISFFTFTQIALLVDCYRGLVSHLRLLNFALFVTYFPHLIAGPIIHHAEVMPQFEKKTIFTIKSKNLLIGLTLFSLGLFKKVVIADHLVNLVMPVFDTHPAVISMFDAWVAALAYSFELYFDFSGYSDMAIGLSLLFGIKLPINFFSPYKATNIIEFWRCWNMTLSRFLRDYLYIPLGGNRKGPVRRYLNLCITMLLGGLWHGANWTFVIWGGLHAIFLSINHGLRALKNPIKLPSYLTRLITFLLVVIAWIFFRAPDFTTAWHILQSMFVPSTYLPQVLQFFSLPKIVLQLSIAAFICFMLPNTYQFIKRYQNFLTKQQWDITTLLWRPTLFWNGTVAFLFALAVCFIQTSSTFLYYQF